MILPASERSQNSAGDRVLWQTLCDGDFDSWSAIRAAHIRSVRQVVATVLGPNGEIEEVSEAVFVGLWEQPRRFDPDRGSLSGYLRMRARNSSIDLLRQEGARHRREANVHREDKQEPCTVEDAAVAVATAQDVRRALADLPEKERSAVVLAYFEGLSYRDVARRLGEPEGSTKSRIRSGLARLRSALEGLADHVPTSQGG